MKRTPEELEQLRKEYQELAALAQEDEAAALLKIGKFSLSGYSHVMSVAEQLGLTGIPYIHFSTFNGWLGRGYCVAKGQHAICSVTSWIVQQDKETGKSYKRPKAAGIFHFSQVVEL